MIEIDLGNIEYKRSVERSKGSFPIIYLTECTQTLGQLSMPRVMITAANDRIIDKINDELTVVGMTNDDKGRPFISPESTEIVRVDGLNRLFVKSARFDTLGPFLKKRGLFDCDDELFAKRSK